MTGVKKLFIYWLGRHNLGQGWQFQKIYRPGKPPGWISQVTWIGCVECDTVKYLKTFRIISSGMLFSLHILFDDILVVCRCIQRRFLISTFMSLKRFFKLFVSKVYRSVVLKNNRSHGIGSHVLIF